MRLSTLYMDNGKWLGLRMRAPGDKAGVVAACSTTDRDQPLLAAVLHLLFGQFYRQISPLGRDFHFQQTDCCPLRQNLYSGSPFIASNVTVFLSPPMSAHVLLPLPSLPRSRSWQMGTPLLHESMEPRKPQLPICVQHSTDALYHLLSALLFLLPRVNPPPVPPTLLLQHAATIPMSTS